MKDVRLVICTYHLQLFTITSRRISVDRTNSDVHVDVTRRAKLKGSWECWPAARKLEKCGGFVLSEDEEVCTVSGLVVIENHGFGSVF